MDHCSREERCKLFEGSYTGHRRGAGPGQGHSPSGTSIHSFDGSRATVLKVHARAEVVASGAGCRCSLQAPTDMWEWGHLVSRPQRLTG